MTTQNENTNKEQWFLIGGSNLQAQYGYGTELEVIAYLDYLNRDRDVNCYQYSEITDSDLLDNLNNDNDDMGFNLDDEARARADM